MKARGRRLIRSASREVLSSFDAAENFPLIVRQKFDSFGSRNTIQQKTTGSKSPPAVSPNRWFFAPDRLPVVHRRGCCLNSRAFSDTRESVRLRGLRSVRLETTSAHA